MLGCRGGVGSPHPPTIWPRAVLAEVRPERRDKRSVIRDKKMGSSVPSADGYQRPPRRDPYGRMVGLLEAERGGIC